MDSKTETSNDTSNDPTSSEVKQPSNGTGMDSKTETSNGTSNDPTGSEVKQPSNGTGKLVHFSDYDEVSTIEPVPPSHQHLQSPLCNTSCIKSVIPVIRWLPKYEWKSNFLHDLIAGLTIAVVHVPQGLAYALLSNVPPIVGIYMGTFPVMVYFLFGTSRHLSVGTFAPVAIMTGGIVNKYIKEHHPGVNLQDIPSIDGIELGIASTVAMCVGFWQLGAYILRFGLFATILNKTLVSAFTAGTAFHILSSQVPNFLGIKIPTETGIFRLIITTLDVFKRINQTNFSALVISIITCIILIINNIFITPRLEDKIQIGLPIELIVIAVGIIITKYCSLQERFSIPTVGVVPSGLQTPSIPLFKSLTRIYLDSILVALVSFATATSIAIKLADKCSYEIDPNQEFLALGLANIVGSFFSCIPIGGSMSRSLVQYKSGGRSQIAGLVCATILIVVILWIGPIFETLPKSILAGIIVISLQPLILQIAKFPEIWKISKQDGILWLFTFIGTIIFDIAYGLAIGVLVAFLFIYQHSTTPYVCALGRITLARDSKNKENDYMFIDMRHAQASEIPGVRVIQISSSLHFANRAYVKTKVQELAGVSPENVLKHQRRMRKAKESEEAIAEKINEIMTVQWRLNTLTTSTTRSAPNSYFQTKQKLQYIIIDLSLVPEADQAAITAIQLLMKLYKDINVLMVVTSMSPKMMVHLYSFPNIRTALRELGRLRRSDLGLLPLEYS